MLNCFTVDEAARELGCAVSTVWRDLAVLQKANFPRLLMSRDLMAPTAGSVLAPFVHAAVAKILAFLPEKACKIAG